MASSISADQLQTQLSEWLENEVAKQAGNDAPVKPDHYRPWHWPVHPVSFDYHIPASEWHGRAQLVTRGQSYDVEVARTPWGVFGRCPVLRAEARGSTVESMLTNMSKLCEPLFARQDQIAELIGEEKKVKNSIRELSHLAKLKLLFASDRAIAHDAQGEIETGGNLSLFGAPLVRVLKETRHRNRRTAQWLVLDLFEDLAAFCPTPAEESEAVGAIRDLMWRAEDDFARTIYKAGVVLGGHVCTEYSADTILELMTAPSRIARRSAMHASFHLCEWLPERKESVLRALEYVAQNDPEQLLRPYAAGLVKDIDRGVVDHIAEPIFPDEP